MFFFALAHMGHFMVIGGVEDDHRPALLQQFLLECLVTLQFTVVVNAKLDLTLTRPATIPVRVRAGKTTSGIVLVGPLAHQFFILLFVRGKVLYLSITVGLREGQVLEYPVDNLHARILRLKTPRGGGGFLIVSLSLSVEFPLTR